MKSQEDLEDRYLPKLLFHREEQRSLIGKYSQVIQRYDVQYLAGYDGVALAQMIQTTYVTPEKDNGLLELCFAINYCATIGVKKAGNTAGKGPGKGGSSTVGKGPGKGGSRSQTTTGDQMIAVL